MRHPPTILRMHPVTLRELGCSHEYVVGHGPVGSRIRGNDVMGSGMTVLRGVHVGSQFRVGG